MREIERFKAQKHYKGQFLFLIHLWSSILRFTKYNQSLDLNLAKFFRFSPDTRNMDTREDAREEVDPFHHIQL